MGEVDRVSVIERDEHRIVVLQCDECGEPRVGCRDLACALVSRPYAGEDVVPAGRLRGAVKALTELLDVLDDAPTLPNDPTWAAIVKARGTLRELRGQ